MTDNFLKGACRGVTATSGAGPAAGVLSCSMTAQRPRQGRVGEATRPNLRPQGGEFSSDRTPSLPRPPTSQGQPEASGPGTPLKASLPGHRARGGVKRWSGAFLSQRRRLPEILEPEIIHCLPPPAPASWPESPQDTPLLSTHPCPTANACNPQFLLTHTDPHPLLAGQGPAVPGCHGPRGGLAALAFLGQIWASQHHLKFFLSFFL